MGVETDHARQFVEDRLATRVDLMRRECHQAGVIALQRCMNGKTHRARAIMKSSANEKRKKKICFAKYHRLKDFLAGNDECISNRKFRSWKRHEPLCFRTSSILRRIENPCSMQGFEMRTDSCRTGTLYRLSVRRGARCPRTAGCRMARVRQESEHSSTKNVAQARPEGHYSVHSNENDFHLQWRARWQRGERRPAGTLH